MAAILEQLRGWYDQNEKKPWCQLERAWLHPKSPLSLLLAHNLQHTNISIDHPTIQASLNVWTYLKEITQSNVYNMNVAIPLDTLVWLIPNTSLNHWLRRDITLLKELMQDDKLMSFKEVQIKFKIPSSEFLTYLQISSLLPRLNTTHTAIPT